MSPPDWSELPAWAHDEVPARSLSAASVATEASERMLCPTSTDDAIAAWLDWVVAISMLAALVPDQERADVLLTWASGGAAC